MRLDASMCLVSVPRRQEEVCQISRWPQTLKSTGEVMGLTLLLAFPQACFFDLGPIL